jgi:uncharacterized protein
MRRLSVIGVIGLSGLLVAGVLALFGVLLSEVRALGSATPSTSIVGGIASASEKTAGLTIVSSGQLTGIQVTGEGMTTVVPNVAILDLGIEATAPTVSEARGQAADAMEALRAALTGKGIEDKDIKTVQFNIYPQRRYDRAKEEDVLTGYSVNNLVTVKVRKVEDTGSVIDAIVDAAGDLVRVNGVNFTLDDPKALYADLLKEAMADAKRKAEQLAQLSGAGLGKPIYISESGGGFPVAFGRFAMGEGGGGGLAAATPIEPGESQVSLNVQVVYAIQ